MAFEDMTDASVKRFNRIMELRRCTPTEAIEFAISAGWLAAEKIANVRLDKRQLRKKLEEDEK